MEFDQVKMKTVLFHVRIVKWIVLIILLAQNVKYELLGTGLL